MSEILGRYCAGFDGVLRGFAPALEIWLKTKAFGEVVSSSLASQPFLQCLPSDLFSAALPITFQGALFGFLEAILAFWKPFWLRIFGLLETIFWPLEAILAFRKHFGLWKPNFCLLEAISPFGKHFRLLEAILAFWTPN